MSSDSAPINLTNHFLIAMPGLSDEVFGRSVVFMCEHSERGALGLVINKPSDILLSELFQKVELELHRDDLMTTPVFQGGPVQVDRGFVLHERMAEQRRDFHRPDARGDGRLGQMKMSRGRVHAP